MSSSNASRGSLDSWFAFALFASLAWLVLTSCSSNPTAAPSIPVATQSATASQVITLHYNERPPYLVTTENGVGGLTGDPSTLAFKKAGIPYQWKQTPSKRQIYILQQNSGRDCLAGWFKNAEREKFAKYTLPIYQDEPQIGLARTDNPKIDSTTTIAELFPNPDLNLLVKDGYSYGDFLDGKIKEYHPTLMVTTQENSGMLKMIFARHADYFLIAPEEANGLIQTSEFDAQDFKFIHFSDMPYGEQRYILCNLQVEDEIIDRLNAAIRQYVTLPRSDW